MNRETRPRGEVWLVAFRHATLVPIAVGSTCLVVPTRLFVLRVCLPGCCDHFNSPVL